MVIINNIVLECSSFKIGDIHLGYLSKQNLIDFLKFGHVLGIYEEKIQFKRRIRNGKLKYFPISRVASL